MVENREIFLANGFHFGVDEAAPVGQRVRITSVPIAKSVTFGLDDVHELVALLVDRPGVMCRPSKLRMVMASRACRSAVMIGTSLSLDEMGKVFLQQFLL